MARKQDAPAQTAGIDKIEWFLQNYFKQLIIGMGIVVLGFIISYGIYNVNQSSKARKANLVGEAQTLMTEETSESVQKFKELSQAVPFLKNYIDLTAAEAWVIIGDNASALQTLPSVSGDYKELAAGLSFDLGDKNIDVLYYAKNGAMKPLWYYRLVLESKPEDRKKNLELFKSLYPGNPLLGLLENWE